MHVSLKMLIIPYRIKKSGKYPVKIRVVYLCEHHDYKIGIDLTEVEFKNAWVGNPKQKYKVTHIRLNAVYQKAQSAVSEMGQAFTFIKFKDLFYGKVQNAFDIFPLIEEYIYILKQSDQLKTAKGYKTTMNSLKRFKSQISFHDITHKFLSEYHNWLLNTHSIKKLKPNQTTKGASESTIGIYMRNVRSIYNYAVSKGIIKMTPDYPFGKRKYVIPAGKNTKKALTIEEVAAIYNYNAIGEALQKARDFWMLSYMCNGINFKDIALLKWRSIDGNMIRFIRSKTKNTNQANQTIISCPITTKIDAIIKKWEVHRKSKEDYIFNILRPEDNLQEQQKKIDQFIKTTNKYIKRICLSLGIEKNVTTYYSRHSAATIMKKSGASIEMISEALGHSNTRTTKSYLDSFDDEAKFELANKLTAF